MTAASSPADISQEVGARSIALGAGLCSLALILGALYFQYVIGVRPCEMCHWQRWPHIGAALLGLLAVPLWRPGKNPLAIAATVLVILCTAAAAYQWVTLADTQPKLLAAAAVAIIGLLAVALWKNDLHLLVTAVIVLVTISGLIGLYQTGTQQHWWSGPSACTGHRYILGSNMMPDVQCDVVTPNQIVFGLSLASYNAIFSLLVAAVAGVLLLRKRA